MASMRSATIDVAKHLYVTGDLMPASLSSQIASPPVFQHFLPILLPPIQLPPPPVEPPKVVPASPREFGFGILSAFCNPEVVDRVLAECDRHEQRCRLLPSRL